MQVYWDGISKGIYDCCSTDGKVTQQLVFSAFGLTYGSHTIMVQMVSGMYCILNVFASMLSMRIFQRSPTRAAALVIALYSPWSHGQNRGVVATSALLAQGAELATSGRLAEAEVPLLQAAQEAPGNTKVLSELAKVEGRLGKKERAVGLFRQVVALQNSSADAHLNLGLALADDGHTEEAVLEVSKSLSLDHSNARAFMIRAQLLSDLVQTKEAAADFSTATRLDPALAEAWFYWATMEFNAGNFSKASSLMEHVIALQPKNTRALMLQGRSFLSESRVDSACDSFRKVLALDPEDSEAIYALSQALRYKDPPESQRLLARFQSLQDEKVKDEQIIETVKKLGNKSIEATERQDWTSAAAFLQQAIALCGQCPLLGDLHKDLGLNACRSGDLETGERELREALELKPADTDIITALRWVDEQRSKR